MAKTAKGKGGSKPRDIDGAIVDAAMNLFAERGFTAVRLQEIAAAADLDLGEMRRRAADKTGILALMLTRVDAAVLGEDAGFAQEDSVRDRLFDLLMRRFDGLMPYREALVRVMHDLRGDPPAMLAMAPRGLSALTWYLEAADTSADGLRGLLRTKGLAVVWLAALRTWLKDDSPDLAATMKTLDTQLARAERMAGWLNAPYPRRRAGRNDTRDDAPDDTREEG